MGKVNSPSLYLPGHLTEVEPLDMATGGAVSNTGLALHRLGIAVGLMGTVGDDPIGKLIIDAFSSRDPALYRLISVLPGQPSSYTIVLSPGHADRSFLHCTGTNAVFDQSNIDFSLVKQAKIFHLGYPPLLPRLFANDGAIFHEICKRAKEIGAIMSVDMVMPDSERPSGQANWPLILKKALPYVDIFVPSIEEILYMLRRDDFWKWQGSVLAHLTADYLRELADEILAMGAVITGFKLGEMGMYLRTAEESQFERLHALPIDHKIWANVALWMPAFQVRVEGTVGAGDSAYAGFLTALLQGLSPLESMRLACAVGACNVEAADATSGIKTLAETNA